MANEVKGGESIDVLERLYGLISPFNKKNVKLGPGTKFVDDLELDSLTIMDLVAAIEDEFDIVMPLNLLPELETVQQVADMVEKIRQEK